MIQDVLEVVHSTTMLPDLEGYVVSQANPIGEPSYYYYSPIEARAPAPRVRRAAPRHFLSKKQKKKMICQVLSQLQGLSASRTGT